MYLQHTKNSFHWYCVEFFSETDYSTCCECSNHHCYDGRYAVYFEENSMVVFEKEQAEQIIEGLIEYSRRNGESFFLEDFKNEHTEISAINVGKIAYIKKVLPITMQRIENN